MDMSQAIMNVNNSVPQTPSNYGNGSIESHTSTASHTQPTELPSWFQWVFLSSRSIYTVD